MKNLIIYSGIALVVLTNIDNKYVDFTNGAKTSQESKKEILNTSHKAMTSAVVLSNFTKEFKNSGCNKKAISLRNFLDLESYNIVCAFEPIELVLSQKRIKTEDQLISEDNAITGNNLSNDAFILDFSLINSVSEEYVSVDSATTAKKEKTAEELIDKDNAITGNNISNETLILDFELINSFAEGYVFVEPINFAKREKTADQLIAEDNAITGNNISNETQALDFDVINKQAKS